MGYVKEVVKYTYRGQSVSSYCKKHGLSYNSIYSKIKKGLPIEEIITQAHKKYPKYYKEIDTKKENWEQIFDTQYEVSSEGRVRRYVANHPMIKKPFYRYLTPYKKTAYKGKFKTAYIQIMVKAGKEYKLQRLVAHHFIRPLTKNDVVINKNGMWDCSVDNLKIISKSESGKRTGHLSRQRKIVMIENGMIKQVFKSTREAEKELYISRQTVSDYCNGKTKKPMYDLKWADELVGD